MSADDYLTKSFDSLEFLACVQVTLGGISAYGARDANDIHAKPIRRGPLSIDLNTHRTAPL